MDRYTWRRLPSDHAPLCLSIAGSPRARQLCSLTHNQPSERGEVLTVSLSRALPSSFSLYSLPHTVDIDPPRVVSVNRRRISFPLECLPHPPLISYDKCLSTSLECHRLDYCIATLSYFLTGCCKRRASGGSSKSAYGIGVEYLLLFSVINCAIRRIF